MSDESSEHSAVTGPAPVLVGGDRRRRWVVFVAGVVGVAVLATAVVLWVISQRRELPVRPVGWHVQTSTVSLDIDPQQDGAERIFPVGEPDFIRAEFTPLTGAPGELEGQDYRFRLIGSWIMPQLDTREQFLGWADLTDAAAPDGSEILVVAMAWRVPRSSYDYPGPDLPSGAVSVVNEHTRFTLDVPDGGNRIQMVVRKGSPVHLEVREQGHVSRLDLRTGSTGGDLPQPTMDGSASVNLDVILNGTMGSDQIPDECRLTGRITGQLRTGLFPSSSTLPGLPGRAKLIVTLSRHPSTPGPPLDLTGQVVCRMASGSFHLDLAQAFSLRDSRGTVTRPEAADVFRCVFTSRLLCGVDVSKDGLVATFDVPEDLRAPTLVFTPVFTVSGSAVDLDRLMNVKLTRWTSDLPPTEFPLNLR